MHESGGSSPSSDKYHVAEGIAQEKWQSSVPDKLSFARKGHNSWVLRFVLLFFDVIILLASHSCRVDWPLLTLESMKVYSKTSLK